MGAATPIGPGDTDVQGFMGDQGFLDRFEAATLVGHKTHMLFSEDLW
jgi:hypothetical protein